MGLSNDIFEILKTSMESDTELDDVQKNNLINISDGITEAIITFLTKQTFTITEMKAVLEVEELKTTTPLVGTVGNQKTVSWPGGASGPLQPVTKGNVDKLNLRKNGGQGGALLSNGYAYIGRGSPRGESNEDLTGVKLLRENIVGE